MKKHVSILVVLLVFALVVVPVLAQSTTKALSTNFTLVNLGAEEATGTVAYYKPDGTEWSATEDFTAAANGGQAIFRQYQEGPGYIETAGRGSAVVSANQPMGAVAQVLARGQDPTSSGAYSGFDAGGTSFYVPLAARKLGTASGEANSQIFVQNASASTVQVNITLVASDGTETYVKASGNIAAGASFMYDLNEEAEANVPNAWYGSAVVEVVGSGEVVVVSNFFTGDAMQTFNAFSGSAPGTKWYAPLFTSRLGNTLSTPIAVQNLSGAEIAVDGIVVTCTPDAGMGAGAQSLTLKNATAVGNTAAYYFNPVTDMAIPEAWYGSCVVESSANVVTFVQMRFIGTGEAAAYEGIRAGSTDTNVIIPLVAKRLGNGFATAVTIQNLSTSGATVDLTYYPSPDYAASTTPIAINDVAIAGEASLIQNHRVSTAIAQIPEGWFGTLVVNSDQPVHAFVQLTFLREVNAALPSGDNYMAHNAFTTP